MDIYSILKIQIIGTILLISIDAIYLKLNSTFYKPILALNNYKVNYLPAFLSWFLIIASIQYFILLQIHQMPKENIVWNVFKNGAVLGFSMYGLYNLVNLATISNWSWKLLIGDTMWGSFITGFMSILLYFIFFRN